MANKITIQPTQFIDLRSGESSFGYRIYDEYSCVYNNILYSNKEAVPSDDLDFLADIAKNPFNKEMREMLEFVVDYKQGIFIGDAWYEWKIIKDIMT